MVAEGRSLEPRRSPTRIRSEDEAAYADARDNRGLTAGLSGTSIAILTFVLFFLYGPWKAGTIDAILFQATLINIVVGLFLMALSSMNFWFVMEALRSDHPDPGKYLRRAERLFGSAWLLVVLEPTLILITAGLYYAGVVAFVFWVVVVVLFSQGWQEAKSPSRTEPVKPSQ